MLMSAILDLLHGCCLVDCVGRGPEQQHDPTTRETAHEKNNCEEGEGVSRGFLPPGSAPRRPPPDRGLCCVSCVLLAGRVAGWMVVGCECIGMIY